MKKYMERINQIDQLLRFEKIGCADDLAEKLGISRSTLFETLNLMKDFGAKIAYCPHRQTYYYAKKYTKIFCRPVRYYRTAALYVCTCKHDSRPSFYRFLKHIVQF